MNSCNRKLQWSDKSIDDFDFPARDDGKSVAEAAREDRQRDFCRTVERDSVGVLRNFDERAVKIEK